MESIQWLVWLSPDFQIKRSVHTRAFGFESFGLASHSRSISAHFPGKNSSVGLFSNSLHSPLCFVCITLLRNVDFRPISRKRIPDLPCLINCGPEKFKCLVLDIWILAIYYISLDGRKRKLVPLRDGGSINSSLAGIRSNECALWLSPPLIRVVTWYTSFIYLFVCFPRDTTEWTMVTTLSMASQYVTDQSPIMMPRRLVFCLDPQCGRIASVCVWDPRAMLEILILEKLFRFPKKRELRSKA